MVSWGQCSCPSVGPRLSSICLSKRSCISPAAWHLGEFLSVHGLFRLVRRSLGYRESRCRAYTASLIRADCENPLGKIKPVKSFLFPVWTTLCIMPVTP